MPFRLHLNCKKRFLLNSLGILMMFTSTLSTFNHQQMAVSYVPTFTNHLFEPVVQSSCVSKSIKVSIMTTHPYHGLVYALGHRNVDNCHTHGMGNNFTQITFNLHQCGMKTDNISKEYSVRLAIGVHPLIVMAQDKTFEVKCPIGEEGLTISHIEPINLEASLTFYRPHHNSTLVPVKILIFGESYILRAKLINSRYQYYIRDCDIINEHSEIKVNLVRYAGCSLDKNVMSDFKENEDGSYVANINSMFYYPPLQSLNIQCKFHLCNSEYCDKPPCQSKYGKISINRFRGTEILVSTTNFVIKPGQVAEALLSRDPCKNDLLISTLCTTFGFLWVTTTIILLLVYFRGRRRGGKSSKEFNPLPLQCGAGNILGGGGGGNSYARHHNFCEVDDGQNQFRFNPLRFRQYISSPHNNYNAGGAGGRANLSSDSAAHFARISSGEEGEDNPTFTPNTHNNQNYAKEPFNSQRPPEIPIYLPRVKRNSVEDVYYRHNENRSMRSIYSHYPVIRVKEGGVGQQGGDLAHCLGFAETFRDEALKYLPKVEEFQTFDFYRPPEQELYQYNKQAPRNTTGSYVVNPTPLGYNGHGRSMVNSNFDLRSNHKETNHYGCLNSSNFPPIDYKTTQESNFIFMSNC